MGHLVPWRLKRVGTSYLARLNSGGRWRIPPYSTLKSGPWSMRYHQKSCPRGAQTDRSSPQFRGNPMGGLDAQTLVQSARALWQGGDGVPQLLAAGRARGNRGSVDQFFSVNELINSRGACARTGVSLAQMPARPRRPPSRRNHSNALYRLGGADFVPKLGQSRPVARP